MKMENGELTLMAEETQTLGKALGIMDCSYFLSQSEDSVEAEAEGKRLDEVLFQIFRTIKRN